MTAVILQVVVGIIGLIKFWYSQQQTETAKEARGYDEIQEIRKAIGGMDVDELNARLDRLLSDGSATGQYDTSNLAERVAASTGASILPRP